MSTFDHFQHAVKLAHRYWRGFVRKGDTVIDATCGNGHDTLDLTRLALENDKGNVIAFDIQAAALEKAQSLLRANVTHEIFERIQWVQGSHAQWPPFVKTMDVRLVVYNLGYLPGGDKGLTTNTETTWQSLQGALEFLQDGGIISITCYPGHEEGKREETLLLEKLASLDPKRWSICHHRWINRNHPPSLIMIEKSS